MDLPGFIVPGHANGYQGGIVRIRSEIDFKFGDYTNEMVLNGTRSMAHFGIQSAHLNDSWLITEPMVKGEKGMMVMDTKCWKGQNYHERFGTNFIVSGQKMYVYSEMDLARVYIVDA
jgi:hypothetical protein